MPLSRWRIVVGGVALVGLALAIVTQAFALAGVDVGHYAPVVWVLHLVALATFAAAGAVINDLREDRQSYFNLIPAWGRVLIGAAFIYGLASFALAETSDLPPGQPRQRDGRYYVQNHGDLTEVSEEVYHAAGALGLQTFSGLWITFITIAGVVLLTARRAETVYAALSNAPA